jgi:hypothetical protein
LVRRFDVIVVGAGQAGQVTGATRLPLGIELTLLSATDPGVYRFSCESHCVSMAAPARSRQGEHIVEHQRAIRMCSRSFSAAAAVARGSVPDPIATVSPISSMVMRIALFFPRTRYTGTAGKALPGPKRSQPSDDPRCARAYGFGSAQRLEPSALSAGMRAGQSPQQRPLRSVSSGGQAGRRSHP